MGEAGVVKRGGWGDEGMGVCPKHYFLLDHTTEAR